MTDDSPDGDADRPRGLVRRTAASFRPCWIRVAGVTLLIIVTAGLGVVNPLLIKEVFDSALFPPAITPARIHSKGRSG